MEQSMARRRAEMTPKRAEVLSWVLGYIGERGFSPTIEEVGEAVKRSEKVASRHIGNLVRDEYLDRDEGIARSMRPGPKVQREHQARAESAGVHAPRVSDLGRAA